MHVSPRRDFLGRLGAAVTALAGGRASGPVGADPPGLDRGRQPQPASSWDMSWVDRLKNASYRAVFDANEVADGFALDLAGMFMDQFRGVYGTRDEEPRAVIVARQLGAPLAFGDSLWARYEIGVETHVNDPTTHAPAPRHPFWSAPAESPRAHDRSTLDALLGRGVTLLLCNIAAMDWAARLAQELERDVEETRNQGRNGLVPGAILVPSGIFALIRAQNAGCAFMRGA